MKKQKFNALVFGLVLLVAMIGCTPAPSARQVASKTPVAENPRQTEPLIDTKIVETLPPAEAETVQQLTEEQARQIALDHIGATADQVTLLRARYEIDDGILQYDVEFYQGDWEYEFEIHAQSGQILSFDKDHKYD